MSSWKVRLLMVLTILAMLLAVSVGPAMADVDDDDDCEDVDFVSGVGFVCEDDGDDNGDDNGEDVDVDVERFGDIVCILVFEEEDDGDEELEDIACFDEDNGHLLWVED